MRNVMLRFVLSSVLLLTVTAAPVRAANTVNYHHPVTGVAELYASTCPFVPLDVGTECTDTVVQYLQAAYGNESARKQPWRLVVLQGHIKLTAVDGDQETWTVLDERWGDAEVPTGEVDTVHMRSAWVTGSVPMSVGPDFAVDLEWDMSGTKLQVAGNDGPTEGGSWGRYADRCITENRIAHQRWRWGGAIAGTLDGVNVDTLYLPDESPFVEGRSVFTIIVTEHGPRC